MILLDARHDDDACANNSIVVHTAYMDRMIVMMIIKMIHGFTDSFKNGKMLGNGNAFHAFVSYECRFNKTEDEFPSKREFDDYLEEREDIS